MDRWLRVFCYPAELQHQHAIAVAEKTVPRPDRVGVGGEHPLPPRKCAYQHQQCRLRQVKVRKQTVHQQEAVVALGARRQK